MKTINKILCTVFLSVFALNCNVNAVPIGDLSIKGLNGNTINALKEAGIETIDDLMKYDKDFTQIYGIGKFRARQIKRALKKYRANGHSNPDMRTATSVKLSRVSRGNKFRELRFPPFPSSEDSSSDSESEVVFKQLIMPSSDSESEGYVENENDGVVLSYSSDDEIFSDTEIGQILEGVASLELEDVANNTSKVKVLINFLNTRSNQVVKEIALVGQCFLNFANVSRNLLIDKICEVIQLIKQRIKSINVQPVVNGKKLVNKTNRTVQSIRNKVSQIPHKKYVTEKALRIGGSGFLLTSTAIPLLRWVALYLLIVQIVKKGFGETLYDVTKRFKPELLEKPLIKELIEFDNKVRHNPKLPSCVNAIIKEVT